MAVSILKEFVHCLAYHREKLVDFVCEHLTEANKKLLMEEVFNMGVSDHITIEPDNKTFYRLLTSTYSNAKYPQTPIEYIPTKNIIEELNVFINLYEIETVDFFGSDYLIFPAILKSINKHITINAMSISNKNIVFDNLNMFPLTTRGLNDYKYYENLQLKRPDILIIDQISDKIPEKKIYNLMKQSDFKYAMILTSAAHNNMNDLCYHLKRVGGYSYKIIPMNFIKPDSEVCNIINNYYEYNTQILLFVRNNSEKTFLNIFDKYAIDTEIDLYPGYFEFASLIYKKYSKNLTNDIFYKMIEKDYSQNSYYTFMQKYYNYIVSTKDASYVMNWEEFVFYTTCLCNNVYFWFKSRIDFLNIFCYYNDICDKKTLRDANNNLFPIWLKTIDDKLIYAYFVVTNNTDTRWKQSITLMYKLWDDINVANRKLMLVQ